MLAPDSGFAMLNIYLLPCEGWLAADAPWLLERSGEVCPDNLQWNQAENQVDPWFTLYHFTKKKKISSLKCSPAGQGVTWSPGPFHPSSNGSGSAQCGWAWHFFVNKKDIKIHVEIFFHHSESMHFAHLKNITNLPVSKLKFVCPAWNNIDSVFLLTSSVSNVSPFSFPLLYPSHSLLQLGVCIHTYTRRCAHVQMCTGFFSPASHKLQGINEYRVFGTGKRWRLTSLRKRLANRGSDSWSLPTLGTSFFLYGISVPLMDFYITVCCRKCLAAHPS